MSNPVVSLFSLYYILALTLLYHYPNTQWIKIKTIYDCERLPGLAGRFFIQACS